MNITIGPELERRINEKVESGLYSSASEVIRDGLRILFEKDIIREQQAEILKEEVIKGFLELEAGNTSKLSVSDIFQKAKEIHGKKS